MPVQSINTRPFKSESQVGDGFKLSHFTALLSLIAVVGIWAYWAIPGLRTNKSSEKDKVAKTQETTGVLGFPASIGNKSTQLPESQINIVYTPTGEVRGGLAVQVGIKTPMATVVPQKPDLKSVNEIEIKTTQVPTIEITEKPKITKTPVPIIKTVVVEVIKTVVVEVIKTVEVPYYFEYVTYILVTELPEVGEGCIDGGDHIVCKGQVEKP